TLGRRTRVPSQHPTVTLVQADDVKARIATYVLETSVMLHVVHVVEQQHVRAIAHRLPQCGEFHPSRAAGGVEQHQGIGITDGKRRRLRFARRQWRQLASIVMKLFGGASAGKDSARKRVEPSPTCVPVSMTCAMRSRTMTSRSNARSSALSCIEIEPRAYSR